MSHDARESDLQQQTQHEHTETQLRDEPAGAQPKLRKASVATATSQPRQPEPAVVAPSDESIATTLSTDADIEDLAGVRGTSDSVDLKVEDELELEKKETATGLGLRLTRSSTARRRHQLENPPDGGLRAWLQVVGAHATVVCTWGFILSFGVFQAYYVDVLDATPSAISWIGSIQIFLLFSLGTFTGRALDAGYFYYTYRTGSALIILSIFMTSLGTKYWHIFLSQGILCGIGNGLVFCPTIALASTYFKARRPLAVGMVTCGSATGGIIIPLMASHLLPKIGFPQTMRMLGCLAIALLLAGNLLLRPRIAPRKTGGIVDWAAFKEPAYTGFAVGMFLVFLGIYFAFFYLSAFAQKHLGVSQPTAINTIVIMNALGMPGRLIPNFIAMRFGPFNLLIMFCAIGSILLLLWQLVESYTGLIVWAVFYGIFGAGIQSLFPATLAGLSPDPSKTGVRMGMIFSIISFACLTGSPIGGALIETLDGQYWGGQTFAGAVGCVGSAVIWGTRRVRMGTWLGGWV